MVGGLANVRNDPKLEINISNYEEHFFSREGRIKRLVPIIMKDILSFITTFMLIYFFGHTLSYATL